MGGFRFQVLVLVMVTSTFCCLQGMQCVVSRVESARCPHCFPACSPASTCEMRTLLPTAQPCQRTVLVSVRCQHPQLTRSLVAISARRVRIFTILSWLLVCAPVPTQTVIFRCLTAPS